MAKLSRLETFVNFGFDSNPFRSAAYQTGDNARIQRILKMAVKERAMVSVVGDRGSGKTWAVKGALKKLGARQVIVRSADKCRLLISDIEQALILDLTDEKPKRGREIRARQLRRILGEASRTQEVVLVIEEGHRLHGMTLRSIKTLRELDWMGESDLFTVVLVGQSDSMSKPGVSEVRLRADTVQMRGLTTSEIAGYIKKSVGRAFTDEAIEAISELPGTGNFLDLQEILVRLMGKALASGRDKVGVEDIAAEFSDFKQALSVTSSPKKKAQIKPVVPDGNATLRSLLGQKSSVASDEGIQEAV